MINGQKFDALSTALRENTSYRLNKDGMKLVRSYHEVIGKIESVLVPVLTPLSDKASDAAKQAAIQIVSSMNSSKTGNEQFNLMSRLDTLTNGGKTPIQGNVFAFNANDKILQYLENI